MAQADRNHSTSPFYRFIKCPELRAIFERASRDYGQTFAIPDEPRLVLDGGAAAEPEVELEVVS
jgi:hypothetical protein